MSNECTVNDLGAHHRYNRYLAFIMHKAMASCQGNPVLEYHSKMLFLLDLKKKLENSVVLNTDLAHHAVPMQKIYRELYGLLFRTKSFGKSYFDKLRLYGEDRQTAKQEEKIIAFLQSWMRKHTSLLGNISTMDAANMPPLISDSAAGIKALGITNAKHFAYALMCYIFAISLIGCSPSSNLIWKKSGRMLIGENQFVHENPWIIGELHRFLMQPEVKKTIGINPLDHDFQIAIYEYSLLRGHGITGKGSIEINSYLYSNSDPAKQLLDVGDAARDRAKEVDDLRRDKPLLILYRNLIVFHEICHLAYMKGLIAMDTGHGVSTRMEVKLALELYKSGKISRELLEKVLNHFIYYNNNESRELSEAFRDTALGLQQIRGK